MNANPLPSVVKVPEVTLGFWVLKILATTLGETGGDAVSMSMGLGYLTSTALFGVLFAAVAAWQIRATQFNGLRYWLTIVTTTTVGTTLADFADRSLGIGYAGGTVLLLALLLGTLLLWQRSLGSVAVGSIDRPAAEAFYWLTILFSQTLGTALGDWTADTAGLGYTGAAAIFSAGLAFLAVAYRWSRWSHTALFWAAFILTRPLGAVVGDFLDKPRAAGGLALDRYSASAVLFALLLVGVLALRQRPAQRAH